MYPARALTWTVQSGVGHTNEEAITPPSVTRGTTKNNHKELPSSTGFALRLEELDAIFNRKKITNIDLKYLIVMNNGPDQSKNQHFISIYHRFSVNIHKLDLMCKIKTHLLAFIITNLSVHLY